ncbi:ankyrin repeat domain-containing protein [Paenibacillus amylolyticus]|uniref:Ankyrin n=1 Tax=Paenibacillus amylolyticus TaxID=1451 RepID=A0A100VI51_PAEAM|nr:ankyrin repeat domain-containing protein [Paenibacillus amylolyticus]GAS80296.1 ankyrin [Paenibacillus amylolyticus]
MNHAEQINQLFQAAQEGHVEKLQSLLDADPEFAITENQDGLTPLGYASHYGQAGAVRVLLEHGANVNAISHSKISFIPSNTALHAALAGERSPEVIHLLLEHGASTSILDSDGQHALHSAAFHTDQTELIEMLLQHGADPSALNSSGQTALHIALERGNTSTASCLQAAVAAR